MIISLCDYTGNIIQPWAEAGYECWIVDLQHPDGIGIKVDNVRRVGSNVLDFKLPDAKIDMIFAFPPCDHLAVSGARWFQGKGLRLLAESLITVSVCNELCLASQAPYFLENPVSTLSTYWRKPDFIFNPYDYAGYLEDPYLEAYSKRTCLWVGNGFVMPVKKRIEVGLHALKVRDTQPVFGRSDLRSETPKGFSKAVYYENYSKVS